MKKFVKILKIMYIFERVQYLVSYLTLLIAADRCVALFTPCQYRCVTLTHKRRIFAICILVTFILSSSFHSWASFVRWEMREIDFFERNSNVSVDYFELAPHELRGDAQQFFVIQIWYNAMFNVAYPVMLAILTGSVIVGLVKKQAAFIRERPGTNSTRAKFNTRRDRRLL